MGRRHAENVLAAISGAPWAITADGMETIITVARRANDPEAAKEFRAIAEKQGQRSEESRYTTVRDGVATIAVHGPLFRYANLFTELSGATSLELLATEIGAALNDNAIRAILLDVDSPGGQVNGTSELAQILARARGRKPIVAVVTGIGASGAYWLASAADEVVAVDTGLLGSIGVVLGIWRDDDEDLVEIVSSQSPKKRVDLDTDEGREELQSMVDNLATVFVEAVARNRGVTVDDVLENFGQGGVLVGRAAVNAGLADRLGTLESVHAELVAGMNTNGGRQAAPHQENEMKTRRTESVAARNASMRIRSNIAAAADDDKDEEEEEEESKRTKAKGRKARADEGEKEEDEEESGRKAKGRKPRADEDDEEEEDEEESKRAKAKGRKARADEDDEEEEEEEASAFATRRPDIAAALRAEGAAAERVRLASIDEIAVAGHERLIAECKADPSCTAATAAERILRAERAKRGAQLSGIRGDEESLAVTGVPAPLAPSATDPAGPTGEATRILTLHRSIQRPSKSRATS